MEDDPAAFHAASMLRLHDISSPASFWELVRVCDARGVTIRLAGLRTPGLFVGYPLPLIILREPCASVLAHELLHAIVAENISLGIAYEEHDREQAARRFAGLLAGAS